MAEEVRNRRRNTLGLDSPDTLSSQDDVAMIYTMLGRYEDAAKLYKDTVERRTKAIGPNHPDTLSSQRDLEMVLATCERLPGVKIISLNA
jgi:Tetratricopeptide repeat